MTPRLAAALALSVALALTGCSGGDDSGSGDGKDGKKEAKVLTAEEAKQLADVAVVTEADLPGYKVEAQTRDATDDEEDKKLAECLGRTVPKVLARNPGKSFSKGSSQIDSSVEVLAEAKEAKAELEAITSDKAPGCIRSVLEETIKADGGTLKDFTATPVDVEIAGSDDAFGYELTVVATSEGQELKLSGYQLGALVGQAQLSLSGLTLGAERLSIDEGKALLTKAVERAKPASA